jgi:hypothetical protein
MYMQGMLLQKEVNGIKYYTSAPTISEKAVNIGKAVVRIAGAVVTGEPVFVSDEIYAARLKVCNACGLWKPDGNGGLGECGHKSCGCTKLKLKLATEVCPMKFWQ